MLLLSNWPSRANLLSQFSGVQMVTGFNFLSRCQSSLSLIAWQQCNWELILSLPVSFIFVINDSTKITDSPPLNGSINTQTSHRFGSYNLSLSRLAAYLEWACNDWAAGLCPLSAELGWGHRNWASRWTAERGEGVGDEAVCLGKKQTEKKINTVQNESEQNEWGRMKDRA